MVIRKDISDSYNLNKQVFDLIENRTEHKIVEKGLNGCEIMISGSTLAEDNRIIFILCLERDNTECLDSLMIILKLLVKAIIFR